MSDSLGDASWHPNDDEEDVVESAPEEDVKQPQHQPDPTGSEKADEEAAAPPDAEAAAPPDAEAPDEQETAGDKAQDGGGGWGGGASEQTADAADADDEETEAAPAPAAPKSTQTEPPEPEEKCVCCCAAHHHARSLNDHEEKGKKIREEVDIWKMEAWGPIGRRAPDPRKRKKRIPCECELLEQAFKDVPEQPAISYNKFLTYHKCSVCDYSKRYKRAAC